VIIICSRCCFFYSFLFVFYLSVRSLFSLTYSFSLPQRQSRRTTLKMKRSTIPHHVFVSFSKTVSETGCRAGNQRVRLMSKGMSNRNSMQFFWRTVHEQVQQIEQPDRFQDRH